MAVIEVQDLQKRYGGRAAVDGVSFTVERGEIFGVLGPNGAGKTTTVECMTGMRRADGGRVSVLGLDPSTQREPLRRRVGIQLQESRQPDRITVREAVELYAAFYADPLDPAGLVDDLGLGPVRDRQFKDLSGGMQQRLSVALALVGNPEVAVLDELTTGLDPAARRDTWTLVEQVRDRGVTIVLVTHFMEEAERLCDRLVLVDSGRVVAAGTPAELVAQVTSEQRIRFTPSGPVDAEALQALPEVYTVGRRGADVEVAGDADLVTAVVLQLAGTDVRVRNLRVEQTTLDDAFLGLTGEGR